MALGWMVEDHFDNVQVVGEEVQSDLGVEVGGEVDLKRDNVEKKTFWAVLMDNCFLIVYKHLIVFSCVNCTQISISRPKQDVHKDMPFNGWSSATPGPISRPFTGLSLEGKKSSVPEIREALSTPPAHLVVLSPA